MEDQSFESPGMVPPEPRRPNGFPSPRRDASPRGLGLRPGTAQSNASSNMGRGDDMPPEAPPQRRRPFMETQPSSVSQRSVASTDNEGSAFHTPSGTPPPPLEVPPRRRPQDIPERLKPATRDPYLNDLPTSQPTPPPTTPLPPPPTAALPEPPAPAPAPVPVPEPVAEPEPVAVPEPIEQPPPQQEVPDEPSPAPSVEPAAPVEEKEAPVASSRFPMLKKVSLSGSTESAANKFRKAAAAAGAFKPRAGGGAAKIFNKETKASDEPDGITGVFKPKPKAPVEAPKEEVIEKKEEEPGSRPTSSRMSLPKITTEVVPAVTVSSPMPTIPAIEEPEPVVEETALVVPEKSEARSTEAAADPEPRKKKRRSNQQVMNISKLGIDSTIMDERGLGFESLLTELGWGGGAAAPKHIEALETDIKREIARVEAGSWLNHLEQKDDRVEAVERMLDRAIAECDELEGLLTLYNVELSVSFAFFISLLMWLTTSIESERRHRVHRSTKPRSAGTNRQPAPVAT